MRLTLVISSLGCGGAERVLVTLAQGFIDSGHEVSVITIFGESRDFYQLPSKVKRIALKVDKKSQDLVEGLQNNLRRLMVLRQQIALTEPDVVISFIARTNILTLLALSGTNYPVVVTEHCDQRFNYLGKVWKILRRVVYTQATKVVSVSKGVNDYFDWLPENKRMVIYNPFFTPQEQPITDSLPPEVNYDRKWITSMGRLTHKKGFDILLNAFAKIAPRFPEWQLLILGKGELQTELERLKIKLNLEEQVVFTGAISNPFPVLRRSKFFVMSSRIEGFPMAHGEALSCGLPVISTDCPSGPREIIRDGIDGILVDNEDLDSLAQAMESLISDESKRKSFATRASEIIDRFGVSTIIKIWEDLFREIRNK